MSDIIVVGSLNMDLIVRAPRLPQPGETIAGHEFSTASGGKGANQAVAAARLGARVAMVGRVGADDFGRALRAALQHDGVDTQCVIEDPGTATGVAMIAVEDHGQNMIVIAPGANGRVMPEDIDRARPAIAKARIMLVQLEIPPETARHALHVARQAGVRTVFNPAPAQALPDDLWPLVDVVVPNETEAEQLTGMATPDADGAERAARELHRRGAGTVVVTLGSRGALALVDGRARLVPAFHVAAVDATAAGDAFVAALAVGLARGAQLDLALREASAAGALATTKLGAQPSLPTRAELECFLEK